MGGLRERCDSNGDFDVLSVHDACLNTEEIIECINSNKPIRITFKLQITRDSEVIWESLLTNNKLYIRIDSNSQVISKMGFLGIMEYAEDLLKVSHIIVCFAKNNPNRQLLVRTFMYIGFVTLPPKHELIPPQDPSNLYMAYSIV